MDTFKYVSRVFKGIPQKNIDSGRMRGLVSDFNETSDRVKDIALPIMVLAVEGGSKLSYHPVQYNLYGIL